MIVEPSRNLADLITKGGQPAYFYRFSYVAENDRNNMLGATHASELPFVFNAPNMLEHPTNLDAEMAYVMSGYWVSFVATGDPNNEHALVKWPRYDRISRHALDFTNGGIFYGHDLIQERLDLWQSYWDNGRVIAKNRER
jgi:para-nitrobenzyl esterase